MLMPFHAAVMLFPGMFVGEVTGRSGPGKGVAAIGLMALIMMQPAGNMLWSLVSIMMTVAVIVDELHRCLTFSAMTVTRGGRAWQHETDGCGRRQ